MRPEILVVINKDSGNLGVSETFLRAHIERLEGKTSVLVGNPGYRREIAGGNPYLMSRSILPLSLRWAWRRAGLATVHTQDTRALAQYIKDRKIEVVLAEYGPTAVSVMDACIRAGVPLVAHFHGYDAYNHYVLDSHGEDYQKLFQCASAIVAVSRHMEKQLVSLGAPPERVVYNSCGADLPSDMVAAPARAKPEFVMLGRLTEKKAPSVSLLAFSKVVSQRPEAHLHVIGDGPLKDSCRQLCRAIGIGENVTFHGALPHPEALRLLASSRGFLQHSVRAPNGDHEGTPVSVLEAMGLGLPVVATRHGGIADVITSPDLGTLVEEFDVEETAQALIRFTLDSRLAQNVGHNARQHILGNWTSERSIERLNTVLRQAMKEHINGVKSYGPATAL